MLIVLSPAKTLDYATPPTISTSTLPLFPDRSAALIKSLKQLSVGDIGKLMAISDPLAELNAARFARWRKKPSVANAKQAVLAFNGDVYEGLDSPSLKLAQLDYLQSHVRILSGLYGVLRPLDLMQPYRLEMGTRLAGQHGKDLYAFWGDSVTEQLNETAAEQGATELVNLASEEYFKVIRKSLLRVPVITPVFQEWTGGQYKVISFYAKRARGLITRFAAQKRLTKVAGLRDFVAEGYGFDAAASDEARWVFRRRAAA